MQLLLPKVMHITYCQLYLTAAASFEVQCCFEVSCIYIFIYIHTHAIATTKSYTYYVLPISDCFVWGSMCCGNAHMYNYIHTNTHSRTIATTKRNAYYILHITNFYIWLLCLRFNAFEVSSKFAHTCAYTHTHTAIRLRLPTVMHITYYHLYLAALFEVQCCFEASSYA